MKRKILNAAASVVLAASLMSAVSTNTVSADEIPEEKNDLPIMYGDVSCNEKVTIKDLEIMYQYLLKEYSLTEDSFIRADMNQDGKVNVFDCIMLRRKIMNTNIYLESDTWKLSASSEETTAYFYADVYEDDVTVNLYNAVTDELIMEMADDGKYSVSGDDLMNDGIYSCKLDIDNSGKNTFYYYAKIEETGEKSDYCKIDVYQILTEQDLADINAVDQKISDLLKSPDYTSLSVEEKKVKLDELFSQLITEGLITDASYNENNQSYAYTYKCGIQGGIMLVPFDPSTDYITN